MRLKDLLLVNTILAIAHALGFLFLPGAMLAFYQIEYHAGAVLMGQLFGAELLVVGIVAWVARGIPDAKGLQGIVLANLIANIAGTLVTVQAMLSGNMGAMGWAGVAIYVLLAVGYAYFVVRREAIGA